MISNGTLWADSIDTTGTVNALEFQLTREGQDKTVFDDAVRVMSSSLPSGSLDIEGFVDQPLEGSIESKMGDAVPMSVLVNGNGRTQGQIAYLFPGKIEAYQAGAAVGDEYKYSLSATAAKVGNLPRPIRGQVLDWREMVTPATDSDSLAVVAGAIPQGQKLYAILHVFAAENTASLDIQIQSAPAAQSGATYTDRITFPSQSYAGTVVRTLNGPINHTAWRTEVDVTGQPGSMPHVCFSVTIAIE